MGIKSLTRAQIRKVDAFVIEKYGIPGIVLMENAARAVSSQALELLLGSRAKFAPVLKPQEPCAAIVCGSGNNGGDGFAVARHLHNKGVHVTIFLAADPQKLQGDAATNYAIVRNVNLRCVDVQTDTQLAAARAELREADLVVDAILGTGFSGELRRPIAQVIYEINMLSQRPTAGRHVPILAVDVPSGLDCDTGIPALPTIRADVTVTFVAPKIGFANPAAQEKLGTVIVSGIGAPPESIVAALNVSEPRKSFLTPSPPLIAPKNPQTAPKDFWYDG